MTSQSRKNQQAIFTEIERMRQENIRMRKALIDYAKPENWSFYHTTTDESIRWVTKLGPDLLGEAAMKKANNYKEKSR